VEKQVVFWIRRDDGGRRKCDWGGSGGRGRGRNNTVDDWVKKKDFAGWTTHVVVLTEGARWQTIKERNLGCSSLSTGSLAPFSCELENIHGGSEHKGGGAVIERQ